MKFEGEQFAQNVQMKQERAELQNQIDDINHQLDDISSQTDDHNTPNEDDAVMVDIPEQELGDLILDGTQNENDKKKYIILGLALLLLFVLTVLIIKLMGSMDDAKTNNSLVETTQETISQDQALNNNDIEKQYQNIIKKKMEEIKKDDAKSLDIEETKKVVEPIKKEEPKKQDIFNLEKKSEKIIEKLKKEETTKKASPVTIAKKPVESYVQKKQIVNKPVVTSFSNSTTNIKPSGVFVQIGAFSKVPNNKYLQNIKNNGYSYKLYKVEVNGRLFVKVLVGPFSSKIKANTNLPDIKRKLDANTAYIIKF